MKKVFIGLLVLLTALLPTLSACAETDAGELFTVYGFVTEIGGPTITVTKGNGETAELEAKALISPEIQVGSAVLATFRAENGMLLTIEEVSCALGVVSGAEEGNVKVTVAGAEYALNVAGGAEFVPGTVLALAGNLEDGAEAAAIPVNEALCGMVMSLPVRVQPGTAGCSLKAVSAAAELLTTVQENGLSAFDCVLAAKACLSMQNEETVFDWMEALRMTVNAAETLAGENAAEILAEAGLSAQNWNAEAFEAVEALTGIFIAFA